MLTEEIISTKLNSTYDRLQEAHWNIHHMEQYYHEADLFRYSLNSFLRVLKEVSQIMQMELQNEKGFTIWFREKRKILTQDPLINDLFKKRDIVVHQVMLKPNSSAQLGITRGRRLKLGMTFPLNPLEDSDVAIIKYLKVTKESGFDLFGLLIDDDDTIPCVERHWRLEPFDEEVITLCVSAWEKVNKLFNETIEWLGGESIPEQLKCVHNSDRISMRLYSRKWLRDIMNSLEDKSPVELLNELQLMRNKK